MASVTRSEGQHGGPVGIDSTRSLSATTEAGVELTTRHTCREPHMGPLCAVDPLSRHWFSCPHRAMPAMNEGLEE
jgi:hypothetical protein